jgi:hypothetical protein
MSGVRWVPRPGGVCWSFEAHGIWYCVITPNFSDRADLFYLSGNQWLFSHSRPLGDSSTKDVAETIRKEITA